MQTNIMNKIVCIYSLEQNKKFLSLIKKTFNGTISKQKKSAFLCLKIAFPSEFYGRFVDCFANAVIEHFKYNYLNQNILLTELEPTQRLALIKALTHFDSDLDKELIITKLRKLDVNIYAESFLTFCVPEFNERLKELCALANNNKAELIMSETFNELFKFILSNLNFTGSEVLICKKYQNIIIYNIKGMELYTISEKNELNIILKLVEMLPRKIVIKVPKSECKALNLVCKLFNNYIEFKN